jgi:LysM repeat protein
MRGRAPIDHRDRPPRRRRVSGPAALAAAALATIGLLALAVLAVFLWWRSDYILPGVWVGPTVVGGRPVGGAAALLEEQWRLPWLQAVVQGEVVPDEEPDPGRTFSPADLGFVLDADGTAALAHAQGRSANSFAELIFGDGAITLSPIWRFDPAAGQAAVATLADQVDIPAVNAGVIIQDGRAQATPPRPGRALDLAVTMAALGKDPAGALERRTIVVHTTEVQPAVMDATAAAEAANQLLATTLTLQTFDPINGQQAEVAIGPQDWSGWLSLDVSQAAAGRLSWRVDEGQLEAYLDEVAASLGPERYLDIPAAAAAVAEAINGRQTTAQVRIYHRDRSHTVQAGETLSSIGRLHGIPYPWIMQANPDLGDQLNAGQVLTIPSPDVMLPLAPVRGKRIVVSISEQRTWVYEDGALKWDWPASTGIDSSPTAPGIFQVQSHEPNAYASNWDLWMPNFMGVYRPVPTSEFMNGFHGFPTRNGTTLLWTGDLGHKVTFGCILLSSENAATLYEWAEEGVVVEIRA